MRHHSGVNLRATVLTRLYVAGELLVGPTGVAKVDDLKARVREQAPQVGYGRCTLPVAHTVLSRPVTPGTSMNSIQHPMISFMYI